VMVATSGDRLLATEAVEALRTKLIPRASLITPNLPEAAALLDAPLAESEAAMRVQAERLLALGARAVLIKGGHIGSSSKAHMQSIDLLYDGREFIEMRAARIPGGAHGLGCALSAAIAAFLAQGMELVGAVRRAKRYVKAALGASFTLGAGRAVLDHFARK